MALTNRRLRKPRLFVCYRRKDGKAQVGQLRKALVAEFGHRRVFMDEESIRPGTNFPAAIQTALSTADVLLVVIGPKWTAVDKRGRTRLHDPQDYVRRELETALKRGIPVFPVLLNGAAMPPAKVLPKFLRPLTEQQAVDLTTVDWELTVRGKLIPAVHDGAREYWKKPPPSAEPLPGAGRVRAAFTAWLQWELPAVSQVVRRAGAGMEAGSRWMAPKLGWWSTAILRLGVAFWALVMVAAWLTVALSFAAGLERLPGDPVTLSVGRIVAGLIVAPLGLLGLCVLCGAMCWGMLSAVEAFVAWREGRPRHSVRVETVWITFACVGLFAIIGIFFATASVAGIIEHQRVPTPADIRFGVGAIAAGGLVLATALGLVSQAALRYRPIRGSHRVVDQYFPLLVGAVALASVGPAVALGQGVGFGVAGAVIALCGACLAVELADRASSRGSYFSGVTMTTVAAGALALLWPP